MTTAFLHQIMSLFFYCRVVHVNKARKRIEIKRKKWWKWEKPVSIAFRNIDYVDLTCPELPERGDDQQQNVPSEIYELFLMTKKPYKRVAIFKFGSSGATHPIHGKIAQKCGELIAEYAGARFGGLRPKEFGLAECNDRYFCNNCGHRLPSNLETCWCQYCGSTDIRIE